MFVKVLNPPLKGQLYQNYQKDIITAPTGHAHLKYFQQISVFIDNLQQGCSA